MKIFSDFDLFDFVMDKVFPLFIIQAVIIISAILFVLLYKLIIS